MSAASTQTSQAGRDEVLPVSDVVEIVREWVNLHASTQPDFAGAYLWGGITALPPDAPFHLYRDVDVVVVLTTGAPDDEGEVFFGGLIIEVIWKNLDEHDDAEVTLANPSAGPNLATTLILADPTGRLTSLHKMVATEYSNRRWIQARCDAEKRMAEEALIAMRVAATPEDRMNSAREFLGAVSGLIAVAQLKRPTTRRTLALLHELLEERGRLDLNELALAVMGSAQMSRAEIEAVHTQILRAFERAAEVYQTHIPYGFAIRPHIRPYYVEGTREMFDEGMYREAMFWISCLDTAYLILRNDAPDSEKPVFEADYQSMQAALGNTSDVLWEKRVEMAARLATEIYHIADSLVAQYPEA